MKSPLRRRTEPREPTLLIASVLGALLVGCGGTQPTATPVVDTAADPLPYVPEVVADPEPGGITAAAATGTSGASLQIVRSFLQAVVRGDNVGVRRLLGATPLFLRRQQPLPREAFLRRLAAIPRSLAGQPQNIDHYIDTATSRVDSAGPYINARTQSYLRPTDRIVSIPIRPDGRRLFDELGLSTGGEATFVVRDADGTVVGL